MADGKRVGGIPTNGGGKKGKVRLALEATQRAKRGRPPSIVEDTKTLTLIESLGSIQCTRLEAAACLGVHQDTFDDFIRDHQKARDMWEKAKESGKQSLRRWQFNVARKGNVAMLIWLGKQYLGQRDALAHTGPEGEKLQIELLFQRGEDLAS